MNFIFCVFKVLQGSDTNSPTHSAAHSPPHSNTHSPTHCPIHSDTHSPTHTPPDSGSHPHIDSHRILIACKKSFAAHFLESSENDCLKTRTDFDETFVEAFPNIVVKGHLCNNKQLPKKKGENKELIEDNTTCFCYIPVATQASPLLWNANRIMFGS